MKLIYIASENKKVIAAESANVNYVMVDLEIIGKKERQGHLNTVISNHNLNDVERIRSLIKKSKLMVRCNPVYSGTYSELNSIVEIGADSIMLPMFTSTSEVEKFTKIIGDRAEKILLLETPAAVARLDNILSLGGFDAIHVGINDLSIASNLNFMFEIVSGGLIEHISNYCKRYGVRFGFGGVGRLNKGVVRSNSILAQHYKYNSSQVILSRDFNSVFECSDTELASLNFSKEVLKIRGFIGDLKTQKSSELENLDSEFKRSVLEMVNKRSNV